MKSENKEKNNGKSGYLIFDFIKATAAIPGLIWVRPKIRYENNNARKRIKGGALVIANHNGFFDPIYLQYGIWYRRHHFICGVEFMKSRAAWFFKQFHCIPVDRSNFTMDTYRKITDVMSAGKIVTMFPEGHVNVTGGEMDTFKPGMIMMALKGGHPIVPVYLKERKNIWQRVAIVIGEPIDIVKMYGERPTFAQINEMTKMLQEKEELLKQMV